MAEIMYQRQDFQNSPEQIQSMGAAARSQRARKIYADNLDEKGNLNEAGFYRGIAQSGLGAEDAQTAMAWRSTQSKRGVDQAVDNQRLRDLGSDPMAGGRNSASIGEPDPVYVPNPDYQTPEAAPKRDALAEWWDSIRGRTAEPPAVPAVVDQSAQIQAQTAPPPGGAVAESEAPVDKRAALAQYLGMDLGESRITPGTQQGHGQMAPLPEGAGASPTTLRPGQDTRSAAQLVEDSYRPENSLVNRTTAAAGGSMEGDDKLFQWNPENNGSNQFQQFAGALGAKLKGLGAIDPQGNPDPGQYLRQVYGATLRANMPPAPNPGLMQGTAEDRVKYYGELNTYAAGVTKAKGQAEQAVLKAKEDLTNYAKTFGENTLESEKFGWTKGARVTVEQEGLDPTRIDADTARELNARKNTLIGMDRMIDTAKDDITGKNGAYAQRTTATAILNNLAQIENVGTEAGNARMTMLLDFAPGIQKAFQEGGIRAVPNAFAQSLVSNPEEGFNALRKMVQMTKEDGILAGQLKAAGAKDPFGSGEHRAPTNTEKLGAALGIKPKANYKATKTNAAGMKMGQKRDGTWEPVR
jgi:hypothetical protein